MSIERISPHDAAARMADGWTYVDVRSVPEFEEGHPEGAFNVPWKHAASGGMVENAEFVRAMRAQFGEGARLILGCRSGNRSMHAATKLQAAGFSHVVDQRAGWGGARGAFGEVTEPGWRDAELPSATAAGVGRAWVDVLNQMEKPS
ncbi:MAG: rhodanese-like domain-containing protein [Sandaracinaceae bacterium]